MVDVEQINIDVSVPSDEVRVVAMQPFVELQTTIEPFQWQDQAVNAQLDAIRRTLDLAQNDSGGGPAHFTLFPEYTIPGREGAAVIDARVNSNEWCNESVIIAGVHGLTKAEYRQLCEQLTVTVADADAPDSVPDGEWVNCCLIWVKDQSGVIRRWVQPKIRPAWPERNVGCTDMFYGNTVYVFECRYAPSGYPCRFVTLICYDWVATVAGTTVSDELLAQLNTQWHGTPSPLHWIFVIQHNNGPNHPAFLNSTYRFLTDTNTFPFVERSDAVVLHVSTAVSALPSRTGLGAFSACVFSPSAQLDVTGCRPTVCMKPASLRGSDILKRCKDAVFREMGECIHMFRVRVPRFVTPDSTDRTHPVNDAQVYATREMTDPRLYGGPVPAAVKWINDSLDCVDELSATTLLGCPLQATAEITAPTVVADMRTHDGQKSADQINWATCTTARGLESRDAERQRDTDLWDQLEHCSLEHVIHSLTSLGLAYDLNVQESSLHGALNDVSGYIQVVAIRGETHEDCRHHYDNAVPKVRTDPVLVIARDRDNLTPTPEEYSKYYEVGTDNGLRFVDYQRLVNFCRTAADRNALRNNLDEILPRTNPIV